MPRRFEEAASGFKGGRCADRPVRMTARLLVALLAAPALLAAAAPDPAPEHLLGALAGELRAHGIDPDVVLAAEARIEVWGADRAPAQARVRVADALARTGLAGIAGETGPEDRFATAVGNIAHGYLNLENDGDARAYRVLTSKALPSSPAFFPPSPADVFLFHVGGPVRQVQGAFDEGAHSVGTNVGSNVATGPGGPYLPLRDGQLLPDRRIEFLGYAEVWQGQVCFDRDICLGFGGFHGTGVGAWDLEEDIPYLPALP